MAASAPSSSLSASANDVLAQLQRIRANLAAADTAAPPTTALRPSSSSTRAPSKAHASVLAPASPSRLQHISSHNIAAAARRGAELLRRQRHDALQYATARANALTAAAAAAAETRATYLTFAERAAAAQRTRDSIAAEERRTRQMLEKASARAMTRTSGFDQVPHSRTPQSASNSSSPGNAGAERDDRLALIESLQVGPRDIPPPDSSDPEWQRFEPYSGTRLKSRRISHQELTEYLQGRCHIPPSMLYSVAKPIYNDSLSKKSGNNNGGSSSWSSRVNGGDAWQRRGRDGDYEVPVDGDWLTMAVIAEQGNPFVTKLFHKTDDDDDDDDERKAAGAGTVQFREATRGSDGKLRLDLDGDGGDRLSASERAKQRRDAAKDDLEGELERERQRLKNRPRYMNIIKLVDLTVRGDDGSDGAGMMAGPGGGTRGERQLKLMSMQADEVDENMRPINSDSAEVQRHLDAMRRGKRRMINGNRGAYELLRKQPPGTLIAILNPIINQPTNKKENLLCIKPRSAEDILVIGQVADLAVCQSIRRDGTRCGNFVHRTATHAGSKGREAEEMYCEFHLSQSVGGLRQGRMEFANSTNGMGHLLPGQRGSNGFGGGGGWKGKSQKALPFVQRYGTMENGLSSNAGKTFTVESSQGVGVTPKATDPESWRFDVGDKLGRGRSEKEARVRRQREKDDLERRMHTRFGPAISPTASQQIAVTRKKVVDTPAAQDGDETLSSESSLSSLSNVKRGGGLEEAAKKLIDPQGSAARLLREAKKTIDERKRKAEQVKEAAMEKRRKILGINKATPATTARTTSRGKGALDPLTSDEDGTTASERTDMPCSTSTSTTTTKSTPRFSYSAEAIKLMGFDPLARRTTPSSRTNLSSSSSSSPSAGTGRDSRSALLDRIKKPNTLPRAPTMKQLKLQKQHRPRVKSFDREDVHPELQGLTFESDEEMDVGDASKDGRSGGDGQEDEDDLELF